MMLTMLWNQKSLILMMRPVLLTVLLVPYSSSAFVFFIHFLSFPAFHGWVGEDHAISDIVSKIHWRFNWIVMALPHSLLGADCFSWVDVVCGIDWCWWYWLRWWWCRRSRRRRWYHDDVDGVDVDDVDDMKVMSDVKDNDMSRMFDLVLQLSWGCFIGSPLCSAWLDKQGNDLYIYTLLRC